MISLSSGLASEIINICNASNMGCEIFQERIPVAPEAEKMAKEFNIDPVIAALNGGEDYELLFTIELKNYEKIKNNDMFSIIGSINAVDKGRNIVMKDGSIITLEPSINNQTFQNVQ
jgi:thiamine-monophosphate kinase